MKSYFHFDIFNERLTFWYHKENTKINFLIASKWHTFVIFFCSYPRMVYYNLEYKGRYMCTNAIYLFICKLTFILAYFHIHFSNWRYHTCPSYLVHIETPTRLGIKLYMSYLGKSSFQNSIVHRYSNSIIVPNSSNMLAMSIPVRNKK